MDEEPRDRDEENKRRRKRRMTEAKKDMARRHCDPPKAYSTSGRRVNRKPVDRDQDSETDD